MKKKLFSGPPGYCGTANKNDRRFMLTLAVFPADPGRLPQKE